MSQEIEKIKLRQLRQRISEESEQEKRRDLSRGVRDTGWIYALESESMPGLLKIGYTRLSVYRRASEISKSTGVPTPLKPVWMAATARPREAEKALHESLREHRVSNNREFFKCSIESVSKNCPLYAHESKKLHSTSAALAEPSSDTRKQSVSISSDLIDCLSEYAAGSTEAICEMALGIAAAVLDRRLENDHLSFTYIDDELVDHRRNLDNILAEGDFLESKLIKKIKAEKGVI